MGLEVKKENKVDFSFTYFIFLLNSYIRDYGEYTHTIYRLVFK